MIMPIPAALWAIASHAPALAVVVTSITTSSAGTMPLAVGVTIPASDNLQKKNPGPTGTEAKLGGSSSVYPTSGAGCNACAHVARGR